MNKLLMVNICIVLLHIIFILVNLTTANKGLRDSTSCGYAGGIDTTGKLCRAQPIPISQLSKDCSAFIYNGIQFDLDEISPRKEPRDLDNLKNLIDGDNRSHYVYLFYKHLSLEAFGTQLYNGDIQVEAQKLKEFIGQFNIKGLIMDGIDKPVKNQDSDDFYKSFANYVTVIKTQNPGLEIGFYLSAKALIQSTSDSNSSNWFDLGQMNPVFDFFIIEFITFNDCIDELLKIGITPFDSPNPNIMTLNKFEDAFKTSTIDKEKVYFELLVMPSVMPSKRKDYPYCEQSYNEYCENHFSYESIWCVDNEDVLYKKGEFANKLSKGVIAIDIDTIDRDQNCKCGDPFIAFHMLVKGYKHEKPLHCDAFKNRS